MPALEPVWSPPEPERPPAARRSRSEERQSTNADGIPRWALPLRSDYDWKRSYPWLVDELVIAEDDDWEYGYSNEGELGRRKKIFADSSFYDEPEHKYPTIKEQIKMAQRVAHSLTAASNVKARGQRMFLRRRERADKWVVSEHPPPGLEASLRRGRIQKTTTFADERPDTTSADTFYYTPTQWASANTGPRRLPWKRDYSPMSTSLTSTSSAGVFRPQSPEKFSTEQPTAKWTPGGGGGQKPSKRVTGFGMGAAMKGGKGGKMFAKRQAQAAEDERRDDLVDTLREKHMAHLGGVPENVNSSSYEADVVDQGPVGRLLELIERSRAASPGLRWTQQTTTRTNVTRDPANIGNFSADIKSRSGSFRPVRFKAPIGAGSQFVARPQVTYDQIMPEEAISDF
jgi:hypothetical protein